MGSQGFIDNMIYEIVSAYDGGVIEVTWRLGLPFVRPAVGTLSQKIRVVQIGPDQQFLLFSLEGTRPEEFAFNYGIPFNDENGNLDVFQSQRINETANLFLIRNSLSQCLTNQGIGQGITFQEENGRVCQTWILKPTHY